MQNEILSTEFWGFHFFQLSAGIVQQGSTSQLHFMKWLKPVLFQLIFPGSSWPPAARRAQCWPCSCWAAPHSWKTLDGSCQPGEPWVLPACPCKRGCPALFLTNGMGCILPWHSCFPSQTPNIHPGGNIFPILWQEGGLCML